jgi:hypothetical protein
LPSMVDRRQSSSNPQPGSYHNAFGLKNLEFPFLRLIYELPHLSVTLLLVKGFQINNVVLIVGHQKEALTSRMQRVTGEESGFH